MNGIKQRIIVHEKMGGGIADIGNIAHNMTAYQNQYVQIIVAMLD
jgi:hypothetical protein